VEEEAERKKLLRNISLYPNWLESGTPQNLKSNSSLQQIVLPQIQPNHNNSHTIYQNYQLRGSIPVFRKKATLEPLKRQIKEEILFEGKCDFGDAVYLVEIFLSLTKKLMIFARSLEAKDRFLIEIESNKVEMLSK